MDTTEPWVRALEQATGELVRMLEQAMTGWPTAADRILGTALGICRFGLRTLAIPELEPVRVQLEQDVVRRRARQFTFFMDLQPGQKRAALEAAAEQVLDEISQGTAKNLAHLFESEPDSDKLFTFAAMLKLQMVDQKRLKPMTIPEASNLADGREVIRIAIRGAEIVGTALKSIPPHP